MEKIDIFAHVLLPNFYYEMLKINPNLLKEIPFINNEVLTDMTRRREISINGVKQIISYVNVNPEDYTDATTSYELCKAANEELITTIRKNSDIFYGGVAIIPMNNIEGAIDIMKNQVVKNKELFGIQLFTRALDKSIADEDYDELVDYAQQEQQNNERPELSTVIENIKQYDTIFLGYPNWWGDMPMPIYTFLDTYDLSAGAV